MSKYCPFITCRLTDQRGKIVSPYDPASIKYTIISDPKDNGQSRGCRYAPDWLPIAIEGYVTVFANEERISPPVPFCILETIHFKVPRNSSVTFQVKDFHCCAIPHCCKDPAVVDEIQLLISIETVAFSQKDVSLWVPQVDSHCKKIDRVCIYTTMVCDEIKFHSECSINYKNTTFRAEVYQYNTIADGIKRTYRNSDELKKYGDRGILSPNEVSYYNVFVNGVMQPKSNYILKKGILTFTTQDVPTKDQPIMILFTTWRGFDGKIMNVTVQQYNAVSDGKKKIYTNFDEIKEYGISGIPSPCEVSYFNLYSNGVLQPAVNYRVKRGVLELTTKDAPVKGAPVILESITIRDRTGHLFQTEALAFNAFSDGGKIYTDQDEIPMYGKQGIPSLRTSAFQNLFVNSVIQPHVNFSVQKGCLIIKTKDSPTVGAPITLQSVKNIPSLHCCNVKMSDAALAQWKKEYPHSKEDPCTSDPPKSEKVQCEQHRTEPK